MWDKIPIQDFALKMQGGKGLCARGVYLRDTTVHTCVLGALFLAVSLLAIKVDICAYRYCPWLRSSETRQTSRKLQCLRSELLLDYCSRVER